MWVCISSSIACIVTMQEKSTTYNNFDRTRILLQTRLFTKLITKEWNRRSSIFWAVLLQSCELDRPNWNHSPVWFTFNVYICVYYMFGYSAHFQSTSSNLRSINCTKQTQPRPQKNTAVLPAKKVLPSFGAFYLGGPVFEQNSSEDKLGKAICSLE